MKYNDNSNWFVSSETGGEPVSLEELKAHLNLSFSGTSTFDDDDEYLSSLIPICREMVENHCGLALKSKTIVAYLRNECGGVELPFGPVFQVTEAKDKNGNSVELVLVGDKFPEIHAPIDDYIKVTFTCGYSRFGTNTIPKSFKQAILEECAWRYSNRGNVDGLGSTNSKSILAPYKKKSWLT